MAISSGGFEDDDTAARGTEEIATGLFFVLMCRGYPIEFLEFNQSDFWHLLSKMVVQVPLINGIEKSRKKVNKEGAILRESQAILQIVLKSETVDMASSSNSSSHAGKNLELTEMEGAKVRLGEN